jgi:DNA-binding NarL/FixJ family response regulator
MHIRLLVVDDHDTMREGLRYAFGGTEMEIVEAANGQSALDILFDQRVDIVLLDVDLPQLNGLEVLSRIKQQLPGLPVLMHSCHDRLAYIQRSFQLGAAGYLIKSPNATQVIEAVRIALAGGNVWTAAQLRHATDREER